MTFPSFITTGGTVDIPTVPLERKALDLTPLIQQMMMNKKASSASTPSSKKDEKDPEIVGTTGQTEQWYDNYKRNQSEIKHLQDWYGDAAYLQPDYRRLINEQDNITNPAVINRLKNNKDRIDAFDATVKAKGASGVINMSALGRYGKGMPYGDWSYLMQRGHLNEGLAITNPDEFIWMEDFPMSPYIATHEDFLAALDKQFSHIGTSQYSVGGGSPNVYQDLRDDWVFLVTENNKTLTNKQSNNNIYGENPTGAGQLDAAKQEALRQAFTGFLGNVEGNPLASGAAASFLSNTTAMVPLSKIGIPGKGNVSAAFQAKAYSDKFIEGEPNAYTYAGDDGKLNKEEEDKYKKDYEDWSVKNQEAGKNYYATHDGYYWKEGQKGPDGKTDISGHLDQQSLLGDFERWVTDVVDSEHKKRLVTVDDFKQDQTIHITATDAWQENANAKKEAAAIVEAANSQKFTIATQDNLGIAESEMSNLFGNKSILDAVVGYVVGNNDWQEVVNTYNGNISQEEIDQMTYSDVSPFIINTLQDGTRTYLPNTQFHGDKIKLYEQSKKTYAINQLKYTEEEAAVYAKEQTEEAIRAHKTVSDNYISKGVKGSVAFDGTKSYITTSDPDFSKYVDTEWYEKVGDKTIGKTAGMLFNNQLAQVGMTVTNGADFFGNAFRYSTKEEGSSIAHLGLANNAGAKVLYEVKINGETYKPGDFIHSTVTDQMTPEQLKEFLPKVDFGSNGYWNIQGRKAISNGKPDKSGKVYASNTNSESIHLALNASGGPNSIAESPTSILVDVELVGAKKDVIAQWKNKTLARELPAYADDPKTKVIYDEAQKASSGHYYGSGSFEQDFENQVTGGKRNDSDQGLARISKKLNIKEGTRAYQELEKIKNIKSTDERTNKIAEAIAIRDGVTGYANWDKRKKVVQESILDEKDNVKEFAKEQMYLREEKNTAGDIFYRVRAGVEVQQQMHVANKVKPAEILNTYNTKRYNTLNVAEPIKQIKVNKLPKK